MEKRWNSGKTSLWLVMVVIFICVGFAFTDYKWRFFSDSFPSPFEPKSAAPTTPSMPEVKLEPIQSPVLDKALKQKLSKEQRNVLLDRLKEKGIEVSIMGSVSDVQVFDFLHELLADEESQRIFREFSKAGISIYLDKEYDVFHGGVWVDIKDGVKKTSEWLAKGKI